MGEVVRSGSPFQARACARALSRARALCAQRPRAYARARRHHVLLFYKLRRCRHFILGCSRILEGMVCPHGESSVYVEVAHHCTQSFTAIQPLPLLYPSRILDGHSGGPRLSHHLASGTSRWRCGTRSHVLKAVFRLRCQIGDIPRETMSPMSVSS